VGGGDAAAGAHHRRAERVSVRKRHRTPLVCLRSWPPNQSWLRSVGDLMDALTLPDRVWWGPERPLSFRDARVVSRGRGRPRLSTWMRSSWRSASRRRPGQGPVPGGTLGAMSRRIRISAARGRCWTVARGRRDLGALLKAGQHLGSEISSPSGAVEEDRARRWWPRRPRYWPPGRAFCLAGPPAEIRPASPVNVFGRVEGDATVFRQVRAGTRVRLERAVGPAPSPPSR
jgi:hypothetical protein